jgi:hypothetical protein
MSRTPVLGHPLDALGQTLPLFIGECPVLLSWTQDKEKQ